MRPRPYDAALIARLEVLCEEIVALVEAREYPTALLDEVEALTGRQYEGGYFIEHWGKESPSQFAQRAALGEAPHVPDITREELIEIVRLVDEVREDIPLQEYYLELFDRNVTHPDGWGLICHPKQYWPAGHTPTPEEIVEKSMWPGNVIRP